MSPGYPGQYPHNADCTWTIRVDYGKRIQFQFAVLQIESHPNCSYDSLEIVEGAMSHVIGRYCNSTSPVPAPITRSLDSLFDHFNSHYHVPQLKPRGAGAFPERQQSFRLRVPHHLGSAGWMWWAFERTQGWSHLVNTAFCSKCMRNICVIVIV